MSIKRIVSAGHFAGGENDDTRVLTRSELPSKLHSCKYTLFKSYQCVLKGFK